MHVNLTSYYSAVRTPSLELTRFLLPWMVYYVFQGVLCSFNYKCSSQALGFILSLSSLMSKPTTLLS